MPQSSAKIYVHIVFSTKYRTPWIRPNIQPELNAYLGAILKSHQSPAINIGGVPDHVHILCLLSKNLAACKLIELIKKRSSRWIKTKGDELIDFRWQNGYGTFSVSHSHVDRVKEYIARQPEHHRQMSFQDEFRDLLQKYDIDYDERYVWD